MKVENLNEKILNIVSPCNDQPVA